MIEWFYGKEGQQYGPVDEVTLRARAATGEIGPGDLVWREGMDSWKPIAEVPELAGIGQPMAGGGTGGVSPAAPNSPYTTPGAAPGGGMYQPAPGLPSTNGCAIASLVCGILSLVFFCILGGIWFGIPAVICGHIGMSQTGAPQNQQGGRGLAIAGLICGYCGIALAGLILLQGSYTYAAQDVFDL
jgi:hypothetical protein